MKPEYAKLIDESELAKCLHGQTRSAIENFNSLIWERVPKIRYCGLMKLKLCVYDALNHFNYGRQSSLDTLKLLNIDAGGNTIMMVSDMNRYGNTMLVNISSKQTKSYSCFKKKEIWFY